MLFVGAFAQGMASERRILVYTKNQVGPGLYVHDNIAASVASIRKLGRENNFAVEVSEDPKVFTDDNLKRFKALVFDNTNNQIFDNEDQKAAFQRFIRGGGGFVGIHSACGSMRDWPWFASMLGGRFKRHPALQPFTVKVKDTRDAATAHLPDFPVDGRILLPGPHARPCTCCWRVTSPRSTIRTRSLCGQAVRQRIAASLAPGIRRRPRVVHRLRPQARVLLGSQVDQSPPGRHSLGHGR